MTTRRSFLSALAALPLLGRMFRCNHVGTGRTYPWTVPLRPATHAVAVNCKACGETLYTIHAAPPPTGEPWVYISQTGQTTEWKA
jgi:hypothetical protein